MRDRTEQFREVVRLMIADEVYDPVRILTWAVPCALFRLGVKCTNSHHIT